MEIRAKAWPLMVSMVVCSLIMAFFTYAIARVEFNYAWWMMKSAGEVQLRGISSYFKSWFIYVWALPAFTGGVATAVILRKVVNETLIGTLLGVIAILHVLWFFFWLSGLYAVHQVFHG